MEPGPSHRDDVPTNCPICKRPFGSALPHEHLRIHGGWRDVLKSIPVAQWLEEMRAQLRATRIGQDAARENARMRVTQYEVQAALLSDVLQTQASLADTNSQYQQALAAFWSARADFERALGEDIAQ